jgi:hypothetical protein
MSLSPSPSKLKAKTEIRIASPAKTDIQGAIAKKSTPTRTMFPKVGVGGGTPTPKKLKLASSLIAVPIQRVLITRVSPKMLGKIWRMTMRKSLAPIDFAAAT